MWRSYHNGDLARQSRFSQVSAARPYHTPTAQIRRDTIKHIRPITPAPRSSPYRAPFARTPPSSWILAPGSILELLELLGLLLQRQLTPIRHLIAMISDESHCAVLRNDHGEIFWIVATEPISGAMPGSGVLG
jgi:hypothetical protein